MSVTRLAQLTKAILAVMVIATVSLLLLIGVAGCSNGKLENPFVRKFVPTPVPPDFSVVIDRNVSTYFSRQHIRQIVTASDLMSRTTFTNLSDYHNTISSQYTVDAPLNHDQLQHMWNKVCRNNLLQGALTWTSWFGPIDAYQRDSMTLQIRADNKEVVYHQLNHWDANKISLVLACESVSLPVGQDIKPVMPPAPNPVHPKTSQPIKPTKTQASEEVPMHTSAATMPTQK